MRFSFWAWGTMVVERYGGIPRSSDNNLGRMLRKMGAPHPLFWRVFLGRKRFGTHSLQSPSPCGIRLYFVHPTLILFSLLLSGNSMIFLSKECLFPFFPRVGGFAQEEKSLLFGSFPCALPKKRGKEDQGDFHLIQNWVFSLDRLYFSCLSGEIFTLAWQLHSRIDQESCLKTTVWTSKLPQNKEPRFPAWNFQSRMGASFLGNGNLKAGKPWSANRELRGWQRRGLSRQVLRGAWKSRTNRELGRG